MSEAAEDIVRRRLTQEELDAICVRHDRLWRAKPGGARAVFAWLDLSGLSLAGRNLADADFTAAVLLDCDLTGAKLDNANFFGADLQGAVLCEASLRRTDLRGACLRGCDLSGADLFEADLREGAVAAADPCWASAFSRRRTARTPRLPGPVWPGPTSSARACPASSPSRPTSPTR